MAASELNLRDYWLIIRKRRWVALIAFTAVMASTVWYTSTQTPIYRATLDVRILERKAVANLLEILMGTVGDPMASQTKVIQSFAVLERAARRLGRLSAASSQDEITAHVLELQGMLSVTVVESTDVIRLVIEGPHPDETARTVTAIAEAYQEANLMEKNSQARALREFAGQQLKDVEAQLLIMEEQLAAYESQGQAQRASLAAATQIAQLEAERDGLLHQYTERHPNVRQLDERIASLRAQLGDTPEAVVAYAQLKREHELADQTYRNLKTKYEEARLAEAEEVPDVAIVNPAVVPTRPVRPNRQMNYLLGLLVAVTFSAMSAFVVEHLDTSIGTIEDVEQYLQLPVLGVIPFLAPAKTMLSHSSWVTELRQMLMPQKPHKAALSRLREQTLMHYPPKSAIADAFRLLRTNVRIEVFGGEPNHKVLMVTSAGNDEGKTVISSNLAIACAQEGRRTLLVDADLRRPSVHRCLGFRKKEPGLTNVLTDATTPEQAVQTFVELMMGDVGFDVAIQTPGLDNLFVITAGAMVYSPPDLLESKALDRFFQWARERYDIIIVDTAPVLAVADPLLLAPKVEAIVLVYKVGKTARKAIQRAKSQLEGIKAKVGGIVLNNISPEVELRSTYYYRKYQYAYEKEPREEAASIEPSAPS